MTISLTARLDEQVRFVQATTMSANWTGATWVNMKGWNKLTIIADALGTGGAVTGGVVTLNQAKTVAAGSAKALNFSRMVYLADLTVAQTEVAQAVTEIAVASNTWSVANADGKRQRYVMEVDADDLDVALGFMCVRFVSTALVNATGVVNYILWGARYSGGSVMID